MMDLLNSLVEYSEFSDISSLKFCESPKYPPPETKISRDQRSQSSIKMQIDDSSNFNRRAASKSVCKMSLFSQNTKIAPRDRLLHRMVHKLEMKCRKHYYGFFVVLQTLKKKNISMKVDVPTKDSSTLQSAFLKINQISSLIFSKYYQRALTSTSFRAIQEYSRTKEGVQKIIKVIYYGRINQGFKEILGLSQKLEKQEIRIDILVSSISSLRRAFMKNSYSSLKYLQLYFNNIKDFTRNTIKENELSPSIFQTAGPKQTAPVYHQDEQIEKQRNLNQLKSYANAKSKKKSLDDSPGKIMKVIDLTFYQQQLKPQKCFDYQKSYKNKAKLQDYMIEGHFIEESRGQVCKKIQPNQLNTMEVEDMYDRNNLFFNQELLSNADVSIFSISNLQIFQSNVKTVSKGGEELAKLLNFDENPSSSQLTIINQLNQQPDFEPKKSITSSSRGSTFGSEAVSFKNSLVCERQSMKDHIVGQQVKPSLFLKVKNKPKNQMKTPECQHSQEDYSRPEARYESAGKETEYRIKQQNFELEAFKKFSFLPLTSEFKALVKASRQVPQSDKNKLQIVSQRKNYAINPKKQNNIEQDKKKQCFIRITKM